MTACVNRKHTKKVAAVVTASLVGALSLGAAPVAAMADTADTGIDLQAVDWNDNVTVTRATDGKGGTVSNPNEASFTQGSGKYLVPVEIANDFTTTKVNTDDYVLNYYNGADATAQLLTSTSKTASTVSGKTPADFFKSDAGKGIYWVAVKNKDGVETNRIAFRIVEEGKVEGVQVKGTVVYNGTDQKSDLKFVDADGNEVKVDGGISNVTFFDGTGHEQAAVQDAGNYVAEFKSNGQAYSVAFTVEKLNLSDASASVSDILTSANSIRDTATFFSALKINDVTPNSTLSGSLVITRVENPDGGSELGVATSGEYSVTFAAKSGDANVTGSKTVTFSKLDDDIADEVNYGRYDVSGFNTERNAYKIYLEDGEAFDASKISVVDTVSDKSYSGEKLEISYLDCDNDKAVDASALANPGTYKVTVRVTPFQEFDSYGLKGGSIEFYVEVVGTSIDADKTVAFYVDGELSGDKATVSYDGTDQLDKVSVVVKDSNGNTMEEGTDYNLVVKKDGKEVDSAVNADEASPYEITVDPITFELTGTATFELTVEKVDLNWLVADVDSMLIPAANNGQIPTSAKDKDGNTYYNEFYVPYTGAALEIPALTYEVPGDSYTYPVLSKDLYNVVSIKKDGKTVDEVLGTGNYTVEIALTDEAAVNYDLIDSDVKFTVKEFGHFTDVDSTKWYSVPVEKAADLGYVNGISGTNLFAPEADITRADAVCILFNMAGGFNLPDDDFSFDVDHGYNTGFSDVDGHAYFAKALAWARAFGVANGYGDGTFAPYAQITREEFASMLANYAKAMGKFEAADEGALDGMSDAGTVSDWATDNVAWAVENGVMGNGGFVAGQSNITRAEVAAMAVNYQPEAL